VSRAYGVLATPHVFIFDQDRKLRYVGRIDDSEQGNSSPTMPATPSKHYWRPKGARRSHPHFRLFDEMVR